MSNFLSERLRGASLSRLSVGLIETVKNALSDLRSITAFAALAAASCSGDVSIDSRTQKPSTSIIDGKNSNTVGEITFAIYDNSRPRIKGKAAHDVEIGLIGLDGTVFDSFSVPEGKTFDVVSNQNDVPCYRISALEAGSSYQDNNIYPVFSGANGCMDASNITDGQREECITFLGQ